MNTAIVYATKYGCTQMCSDLIADKVNGDVKRINLNTDKFDDLSDYDQIIIGSPIYIGKIQKKVKTFCLTHLEELKQKRVGLFTCSMQIEDISLKQLEDNYPQELFNHAIVTEWFGGQITFDKMSFIDRTMTKMVAKSDKNFPPLDEHKNATTISIDKIKQFTNVLNKTV